MSDQDNGDSDNGIDYVGAEPSIPEFGVLGPPRLTSTRTEEQIRGLVTWLFQFYNAINAQDIDGRFRDIYQRLSNVYTVLNEISKIEFISEGASDPPTQAEVEELQDQVNEIVQKARLIQQILEQEAEAESSDDSETSGE